MTNNFSVLFKKYSIPALLLLIGFALLIFGFMKNQSITFHFSSALMLLAGVLSLLFSSGKLKNSILVIVGILAGAIGIALVYISGNEVITEMNYQDKVKMSETMAKQNLEDVIFIQKAYQAQYGVYANSWDKLIDYVKNGKIDFIESEGSVPARKYDPAERAYLYGDNRAIDNNMTEEEAYRLSKWKAGPNWEKDFRSFKRDTLKVSLLVSKFQSDSYKKAREIVNIGTFNADSLRYIPYTNGKREWMLLTKDSLKLADGTTAPAIRVTGKLPFTKKEMSFGSLVKPNEFSATWENK
jgi:hypothetical protein